MDSVAQSTVVASGWQIASTIASSAAVLVAIVVTIINLMHRAADKVEKRQDEEARLLSQARLVVIAEIPFEVGYTDFDVNSYASQEREYYSRRLSNHGDRPILDLHSEFWIKDADGNYNYNCRRFSVILAGSEKTMTIGVNKGGALSAWRLRWTDADGRQWCKGLIDADGPVSYNGELPDGIPSTSVLGSD
ncbi:hypothetical protein [Amycolatopsis sp. NPDC059021]|uniref:hypothetical protein n=1 Tax=Amycolatopsis sp. NPDC059021 TaxID=3346704 RepID=UPI00366A6B25